MAMQESRPPVFSRGGQEVHTPVQRLRQVNFDQLALAAGLAVALVALGILGGQLWRELRSERANNRERAERIEAVAAAPSPAQAVPAQSLPEAVSNAMHDVVVEPTAADTPAPQSRNVLEGFRERLATPEGQSALLASARRTLEQRYPDVAAALGLSAAEVDAVLDLLAAQLAATAADLLPSQTGVEELLSRRAAAERDNQRALAQLLGPRHDKWEQYQQTAARRWMNNTQRQQVRGLLAVVRSERNPMTDAQFESFEAALKAEEQIIDRESSGQSRQQQLAGVNERTRRMVAVAAAHLNPEQLAEYEAHLEQQATTMRARLGKIDAAEGY
jgi:hypothetical protein